MCRVLNERFNFFSTVLCVVSRWRTRWWRSGSWMTPYRIQRSSVRRPGPSARVCSSKRSTKGSASGTDRVTSSGNTPSSARSTGGNWTQVCVGQKQTWSDSLLIVTGHCFMCLHHYCTKTHICIWFSAVLKVVFFNSFWIVLTKFVSESLPVDWNSLYFIEPALFVLKRFCSLIEESRAQFISNFFLIFTQVSHALKTLCSKSAASFSNRKFEQFGLFSQDIAVFCFVLFLFY